jgi:adenylosuccinate synthase
MRLAGPVMLRHSCRLNSLSGLVVTRLDILSGFETVKVATSYKLDGEEIGYVPMNTFEFDRVEPVYKEMPGWSGDLRTCRKLEDLPKEARSYLDFMEEFTQTPAAILSVGPDRDETIIVKPELIWG